MANAIVDVLKQNGRLVRELGVENAKLREYLVMIADPTVDRDESIGLAREALGWKLEE